MAIDTAVSTCVGAIFSGGVKKIGGKIVNKIGMNTITNKLKITGRGSLQSLYRQVDTNIHTGTWKLESLSVKTWGKSILSETINAAPSIITGQGLNLIQNHIKDRKYKAMEYISDIVNNMNEINKDNLCMEE